MITRTTTIFKLIKSELINRYNFDEFKKDNRLSFNDSEHSVIHEITTYSDDVKEIVNNWIFTGFKLDDVSQDDDFKHAFINRFLHREIKYQTFELFRSELISMMYEKSLFINELYSNLDKYLTALSESESTSSGENSSNQINRHRQLQSELPQNETNISLDINEMEYADNVQMSNIGSENTGNNSQESNSKSTQYNIDNIFKIQSLLTDLMNEIDNRLFSQVW